MLWVYFHRVYVCVFVCMNVCSTTFVRNENVILPFAPTRSLSLSLFCHNSFFYSLHCVVNLPALDLFSAYLNILHAFFILFICYNFVLQTMEKCFQLICVWMWYTFWCASCALCVCVYVRPGWLFEMQYFIVVCQLSVCAVFHFNFIHSSLPDTNDRLTMATAVTGITPHVTF